MTEERLWERVSCAYAQTDTHKQVIRYIHTRACVCVCTYVCATTNDTDTVFIDLKSTFDVVNKGIILEQPGAAGVKGSLLRWIRGGPSTVLFQGALGDTKAFEPGTPSVKGAQPYPFQRADP